MAAGTAASLADVGRNARGSCFVVADAVSCVGPVFSYDGL